MARRRAQVDGDDAVDRDVTVNVENFMAEQALKDRDKAKAKHVDDGLEAVREKVDRMRKGIAYAGTLKDADTKAAVLAEVADTAAKVTDDVRRALRNAASETRNLQR